MRARGFAAALAAVVLGATAACGDNRDMTEQDLTTGETRSAELQVLDAWADLLPEAGGDADITTDQGTSDYGTTIELLVEGLQPNTEYPAHVHAGTCEDEPPGGEHWSSEPDGELETPTHFHTYVITDGEGRGAMTDESDLVVDDRALSVVLHAAGSNDRLQEAGSDRLLCGDLVPE